MEASTTVLLFDIDGTLIDSAGAGGSALLKAFQREFNLLDAKPVSLHGRTDMGIMTELLESHQFQATLAERQRLCDHYFRILPEELTQRPGRVLPGVLQMLGALSLIDTCCLGVLTGNMPRSADMKLKHFQLDHFFDFGIFGDQAVHRRELRDPALRCVHQRLGVPIPPEQIVVIGDTAMDVELAQAMGARCLAVCTGGIEASLLIAAGADHVVKDLSSTQEILQWCLASPKAGSTVSPSK